MQTLRATQLFSGRLLNDEVITLHSGNERAFEDADAEALLREFPDRFEIVAFTIEASATDLTAPNTTANTAPFVDPSLVTSPPVEVPPEVEKFGAQAEVKSKTKKGK